MAFQVYPASFIEPLEVPATSSSPQQTLMELQSVGPSGQPEMYIRFNGVDEAALGAVITDEPSFTLRFGGSTSATLTSAAPTAELNDGFIGHVCELSLSRISALQNLWEIRVIFSEGGPTGGAWFLNIGNNEPSARKFVWVVGDSAAEAAQPWLHVVQPSVDFDANGLALSGEATIESLTVKNFGTGPLNIAPQATPNPAFALGGLPVAIEPNLSASIPVTFTAPSSVGAHSAGLDLASNDTTAQVVPGSNHNRHTDLGATSTQIETVLVLDASGSMNTTPTGGVAPTPADSRWGKLQDGAEHFLDLLAAHASGAGQFGVVVFPDITSPSVNDIATPTSRQLFSPSPINGANTASAKATLAITPQGWTPIGKGIEHAIGAGVSFGMFQGTADALAFNRRAVVVMTDGAHNSPPLPGSPKPADFYQAGAGISDALHDKHIQVLGVAYGSEGSPEVDRAAIQTLVTESGAAGDAFVDAIAPFDPLNPDPLFKAFRQVLLANLELHSASDPLGTLTDANPEARHPISITHYDKRVSFVVNWPGTEELSVTLVTPTCDVITRQSADGKSGVTFRGGARYAIFTVEQSYLRNDDNPQSPRYGTWRLIVGRNLSNDLVRGRRADIRYEYDVLTQSGIKLHASVDGAAVHAPGEPLTLRARLFADGVPVRNASVSVSVAVPGASLDNFLGKAVVSQEEFEKAKRELNGGFDVRSLAIKAKALEKKGIVFQPSQQTFQYFLKETSDGCYEATVPGFQTPGNRTFYMVATGETSDGVSFRRERQLGVQIVVRPLPDYSIVVLDYFQLDNAVHASLQLFVRDQFDNAIVFDPELEERIRVKAGAEPTGPLVDRLDGSYSQTLRLSNERSIRAAISVDGRALLREFPVPNPARLRYVDKVIAFEPGRVSKRGGNEHAKPEAVLGPLLEKPKDQFVSLGGGGVLALGVKAKRVVGESVTVFVRPDTPLRPYVVEAMADADRRAFRVQSESYEKVAGMLTRGRGQIAYAGGRAEAKYGSFSFGKEPAPFSFVACVAGHATGQRLRVVLDTGQVIAEIAIDAIGPEPVELSAMTLPVSGRHAFNVVLSDASDRPLSALAAAKRALTFNWFEFRQSWVRLGSSKGVTDTFSLSPLVDQRLEGGALALRIVDTSDRTLDAEGRPSPTPGVSVRAVGIDGLS